MKIKYDVLVVFLLVALAALSGSFHVNYRRLKNEIFKLRIRKEIDRRNCQRPIINCPRSIARKPILVSYAQVFEDIILYDVLGDVEDGFYIDVGANHPIEDSVTKFFYEEGYRGINIEPLLHEYDMLKQDRPRDINLCVCAGAENGELALYERGGLSTLDVNIANKWDIVPSPRKVKIIPLSWICKEYCPKGQEIQFCKIDVEGFEREVLLGFDFQNFRPKIFLIEATEPCTMIPTEQKWEEILLNNGYEFAYQYGVNRYYVDSRFPDLKEKFVGMGKIMDKYIIMKW
ncbi:MAG: FkbM family methyltransferase [Puniceicoccales bacterium]|jgi:FkbM family methyltransferase|nr:FkbM family methyltransferase [Puniceicoccales bacterium]